MGKRRALVLVDIQNEYQAGGKMELVGAAEAAAVAGKVLAEARARGVPVFHVRHESTPGSPRFAPGTHGSTIADPVTPLATEPVVTKHAVDSFQDTVLGELLGAAYAGTGVEELVVAGMMTHMCVDAILRAATSRGISCALVTDACATRDLEWKGRRVNAADVSAAFYAAFAAFGVHMTDSASWLPRGP